MSEPVGRNNPREIGYAKKGDNYNIQCPFCDFVIHYVTDGFNIPFESVRVFSKKCPSCNKLIEFRASWEIQVIADNPLILEGQEETISDGIARNKESISGKNII
jgi:C4-type Zn-finger protein